MAAKPSEAGDQTTPTQTDSRFEFLASVVHKSLRLKPDRWAKLMSVDEAKRTILDFLDHADPPLIVFTQSGPGILSVTHFALNTAGHPAVVLTGGGTGSSSKLKSLYFLKKRAEPVSPIDPRRHLLYGDLSTQPLDQVLTFLDEVRTLFY
jgi:dynein heavy chain, axonemal